MGHMRLRGLPHSRPWQKVIAHIAEGGTISEIVAATIAASAKGLDLAIDDAGTTHTTHLLCTIARSGGQMAVLHREGLVVPGRPDLLDLTVAFGEAVEAEMHRAGGRTDLGEMSRLAGIEGLGRALTPRGRRLLEVTPDEVRDQIVSMGEVRGFTRLFVEHYSAFINRYLLYHLGRELSLHVGSNGRFADVDDHNAFLADLRQHSRRSAWDVREHAVDWFERHPGPITPSQTRSFSNSYIKVVRQELLRQGGPEWPNLT